ncbi:MAG TPA: MBL fold metallo-hydrolase [Pseudonocardiaceae bacterium]
MRIVHFGHSCVLLETATARLLLDPGGFSAGFEDLRELTAILITHQHPDHLDQARLPALVAANPQATLVVDPDTHAVITKLGLTATVANPGDALELGGAAINAVGAQHATIYRDFPGITNAGYVVDHGAFYHPGDSFHVPEQAIDVLGVPIYAPWMKIAEAADYVHAVKPRVSVPIHEGMLTNPPFVDALLERFTADTAPVRQLVKGEPTEV